MGWLRLVGSIKIIGLFCERALQKRLYSAEETYIFKEPTNRSHPICVSLMSSAISEDASASLYHCAVKAQGLSGRALRKLPFLAHAKFLRSKGVWHIGECVYARLRAESCV